MLTLKVSDDAARPGRNSFLTLTGTPDASCVMMMVSASLDNCGPCKSGTADCTGCGTNTCTGTAAGALVTQ